MDINLKPLGELKYIAPKDYFKHEEKVFTPWLCQPENIRKLGVALRMPNLVVEGSEVDVLNYEVDIVAKDPDTNKLVVIENQIENSDHKHLGQLITYVSGLKAQAAVWIVKESSEGHQQAIQWLNEMAGNNCSFFLVEIHLLQIDDSRLAAKFEVKEQPNKYAQTAEKQIKNSQLTATKLLYKEFWDSFNDLAYADKDTPYAKDFSRHAAQSRGLHQIFSKNKAQLRFHVNSDQGDSLGIKVFAKSPGSKWLEAIKENQKEIEEEVGAPIVFTKEDDEVEKGFWIYKPGCPIEEKNKWPSYVDWFTETAPKALKVLLRYEPLIVNPDEQEDDYAEGESEEE